MKCPKCETENPDGKKFCRECGAKLVLICPQCGGEILPSDKFCGECGHKLTLSPEPIPKELSFDEKIAKIQRYLPKGLTEKILSQRDKIEGERKQVTVMFCDMEGFTALVEKMGPEDAYKIMDQVYEILIHKVHDYEGTVNEMTGDGIMALFGAPIALEDAPQRAIRSAYSIHREMARISDRMKGNKQDIASLKMRVGIHTGPVVVGALGNDLRLEFKAVGDTVNLASRMEGFAEPGTTYVTGETFKLTEGFFRFEALGEKLFKGKGEPVKVYRVIGLSSRRTRFDVSAERGLTPFVGRGRELELLIDGFERAKAGLGQAVSIVSEAGIGKSRLLYEFRKSVSNENVTFLEGKCLPYKKNLAYHPIVDIIKSSFNIRNNDGDFEIRDRVSKDLKTLKADEATTLPYILELLSVNDSGINKIPMSPEARKERIMEAVKKITLRGSDVRPLIVAFEDLQWVDKSSEDYLKHFLDCISGSRLLLIFTYRTEYTPSWRTKSYHRQVNLNRLTEQDSLSMVFHLLRTKNLENDLLKLISQKAEGIPFFIEEFIKSLKDLKIIVKKNGTYRFTPDIQEVTIPSTLQDIIMARVDSLPEDAREILQIGSVIGRTFTYELYKKITGISEHQLLMRMNVLKTSELIYERGIHPELVYVFKHALTQEIIYNSLLTIRKKKLHGKVGNGVEELYKKNIEKYYGVLVDHYMASENYEKAAYYSKLAAKKAEKTASLNDSIAYAKKEIESLEALYQTNEVQKKIIDSRTALGLYYLQINYPVEAKKSVEPIVQLAIDQDYKRRLSQIYTVIGTNSYIVEEDFDKAFHYLHDALAISEKMHDVLSLVMATYWLGLGLAFYCEYEKALLYLEEALKINASANVQWGVALVKSVISAYVYNYQGKINLTS